MNPFALAFWIVAWIVVACVCYSLGGSTAAVAGLLIAVSASPAISVLAGHHVFDDF